MYILLSSTARRQYKDDILRCLATPIGSDIQFRYAKKYVSSEVLDDLDNNKSEYGLVCYTNNNPNSNDEFIYNSIRRVKIVNICEHGSSVSVKLKTKEFAFSDTLVLNKEISKYIETYESDKDQKDKSERKRYFLTKFPGEISSVNYCDSLNTWEKIVDQLFLQKDFAIEPIFWTILGLQEVDKNKLNVCKNKFTFWPNKISFYKDYSLNLYSYLPRTGNNKCSDCSLIVKSNQYLVSIYPEEIQINSPYDLKQWRFRVDPNSPFRVKNAWLQISRKTLPTPDESESPVMIDLPLIFRKPLNRIISYSLIIALSLNFSELISAFETRAFKTFAIQFTKSLLSSVLIFFGIN